MDTALQSLKLHLPQASRLLLWPPDVSVEDSTTLLLVVDSYHAKRRQSLLQNAEEAMPEELAHLRLALVTEGELESLMAWGASCQATQWVVDELQKEEPDYHRLRSVVHPALNEQARILRLVEQEFPNVGLDSWMLGLRLQGVLESLMAWAFALHKLRWQGSQDDWDWMRQQWCGDDHTRLFDAAFADFPRELAAFEERHRLLQELPLHQYPENDREVDALLRTLQKAVSQLRSHARKQLYTLEEVRQTRSRFATIAGGLLVVALVVFAVGWWWTRPTWVRSLRNFKPPGSPAGITGYYYIGLNFNKMMLKRTDPTLDMVWRGSPGTSIGRDRFSVRWSGYLWVPSTGEYKLCFRHDDGGRMTISNKVVSADWRHGSSREQCRRLYLEKGWHPLKAEMYESRGIAVAQLSWQKPGQTQTSIVPTGNLCCRLAGPKKRANPRKRPAARHAAKTPNRPLRRKTRPRTKVHKRPVARRPLPLRKAGERPTPSRRRPSRRFPKRRSQRRTPPKSR
jgi:hypothetical protein